MISPASGAVPLNGAARPGAGDASADGALAAWGREDRAARATEDVATRRGVADLSRTDGGAPDASKVMASAARAAGLAPNAEPGAEATGQAPAIDDPWGKVLAAAGPNRRLRILLNDISLVSVENDVVVLAVSEALHGAARASEKELCGLLASAWDRAVKLELRQEGGEAAATPAASQASINANLLALQEHPLVKQAMELFGAKVVSVQARKNATKQDERGGGTQAGNTTNV